MEENTSTIRESVLAELRRQGIKLWLPPYIHPTTGTPEIDLLEKLAQDILKQRRNGGKDSSIAVSEVLDEAKYKEEIRKSLESLQEHSLKKLAQKQKKAGAINNTNTNTTSATTTTKSLERLEVRILCSENDRKFLLSIGSKQELSLKNNNNWAQEVKLDFDEKKALIHIRGLSTKILVGQFIRDFKTFLCAGQLRLVHQGRTPLASDDEKTLIQFLTERSSSAAAAAASFSKILCIASDFAAADASSSSTSSSSSSSSTVQPERAIIESIRQAAVRLGRGTRQFEITDQHGRHVPMSPTDQLSFITALGLHRLGRTRLESNHSSALVCFLEADAEWDRATGLHDWRNKVDNYGLLQLDIAWTYLLLESLDSLDDATRRLDLAESVLRKQVHANFVTLALVQAEAGNPVPPLAAVFIRLFLLRGVCYLYAGDTSNSHQCLDRALCLCRALRLAAPPDVVLRLCEAVGASPFEAVAALRKATGSLGSNAASSAAIVADRAAVILTEDRDRVKQENTNRQTQRRLGLCQNQSDYVQLDLIPQVQQVLGLGDAGNSGFTSTNHHHHPTAVGLLRLANNSLDRAIDLYQDVQRQDEVILSKVHVLDQTLRERGLAHNQSFRPPAQAVVDDVALTTMISMGIEEPRARRALGRCQNNVDMALLWLSRSGTKRTRRTMMMADANPSSVDAKKTTTTTTVTEIEAGSDAANPKTETMETKTTITAAAAGTEIEAGSDAANAKTETMETEDADDKTHAKEEKADETMDDVSSVAVKKTNELAEQNEDVTEWNESDDDEEEEEEEEEFNQEEDDALQLLEQEFGRVLQEGDLEKDYLGNSLDEEWRLLQKYAPN